MKEIAVVQMGKAKFSRHLPHKKPMDKLKTLDVLRKSYVIL